MANNNRIDTIKALSGFPPAVKNVPPNYPTGPAPGKISLLFNFNSKEIYHKFSPYTNRDSILNFLPNKQPFVWRFPDEGNKTVIGTLPSKFKAFESQALPIRSTLDDLVRLGKFSISPDGVIFYLKQGALQLLQPFPETRIYNPLSVFLSALQPASLGFLPRVNRHIDVTGFISGIFSGNTSVPASSVGSQALSTEAASSGKGLLRGPTAGSAYYKLQSKWPVANQSSTFSFPSLISVIKNFAKSLFLGTSDAYPTSQFRADEKTFELMLSSNRFPVTQSWLPTIRYSDVFVESGETQFKILNNYAKYNEPGGQRNIFYQTKLDDPQSAVVKSINLSLQNVINGIKNAGYNVVISDNNQRALSSPQASVIGYNKITEASTNNQKYLNEYRFKTITLNDNNIHSTEMTKKFSTTQRSDGMNRISILNKNKRINEIIPMDDFKGWTEWKPYKDDLIAFYFYDVVNEKYIPFRATVKGISEAASANWNELRFIGRADQVYTYSGFTRTLGFSFNLVIGSIKELLPVWRKINYIMSVVKPSNYTKKDNQPFNRFIVPPMFMLTIGDLYKLHPVIIKSITMNIPDDASWETSNENNVTDNLWSYLNNTIQAQSVGKNFAQLPREIEIVVSCDILEKERPIVGAATFGNATHTDDYIIDQFVPDINGEQPSEFHKNMIEYNGDTDPKIEEGRQLIPSTSQPINQNLVQTSTTNNSSQLTTQDPTKVPTTTGIVSGKAVSPTNITPSTNLNTKITIPSGV